MAGQAPQSAGDDLAVTFLAQGEQTGAQIAGQLAAFIGGARRSLDMALYDFRLSDPLKAIVAGALRERASAGVAIRIARPTVARPVGVGSTHATRRSSSLWVRVA